MKTRLAWLMAVGLLLLGGVCSAEEPASADQEKQPGPIVQSLQRTTTDTSPEDRTRVDATGAVWTYEPRWGWSTNWRDYYQFDKPYMPGVGWPKRLPGYTLHFEQPRPVLWPVQYYWYYPYRYYGPFYPAYGYGYYGPPIVNVIVNNNF